MENKTINIDKQYESIESIINEKYSSLAVYLLSSENDDYDLYKLSLSDNTVFKKIILKCIGKTDETCEFYDYINDIKPDGITSILYLNDSDMPNYANLKNRIVSDDSQPINEDKLNEIFSTIKGYVIKVTYIENNCKKNLIAYSKLFNSHIYTPKNRFFKFSKDKELMEKIDSTMIQFNESLLSININGIMFVLSKYYFEQLFKYEEQIEKFSQKTIEIIKSTNLIKNFDIFKEYCDKNKNHKRKLSNMTNKPCVIATTFEKFRDLKNSHGDNLFYDIDEENKKIIIDESKLAKSTNHVIRIFNDEAATTFITGTPIFATEKIPIKVTN